MTDAGSVAMGGAAPGREAARVPPARRYRGPRGVGAALPGLPQLLAGRWAAGGSGLATWLALFSLAWFRRDRLSAAVAGPLDLRLAVATLLAGVAVAWIWSWRDLSRGPVLEPVGGRWGPVVRAFRRNRTATVGLIAIVGFYMVALLTPLLAPHDPNFQYDLVTQRLAPPSAAFPLGTDHNARDVLSRILYGARISLSIGFVAVGISVTLGTVIGAVAGYLGGRVDAAIMRFVDMVISVPRLILLIAIIALFEQPSIFLIMAVLGLTQWPYTSRIVRSEVLSLREREFIQAARALGYSRWRIIRRHLIPNTLAPVIVAATLGIGNTIVIEAGLSFLGLGVQPPTPSWGTMVAAGRDFLPSDWWLSTYPGLAIVFTVLAFNLVGDGLRDALDPRLRQ